MINFVMFENADELDMYIRERRDDIDLGETPREYPCLGAVYMCPDETYDMHFLYADDLRRFAGLVNVGAKPLASID